MRTPVPSINHGRIFIGIDPGLSGVVAALHDLPNERPHITIENVPTVAVAKTSRGKKTKTKRMYDLQGFFDLLAGFKGTVAVAGLEELIGRPGLSSQSVFGMGVAYGLFRMALVAHQIPHVLVPPQKWKRALDVLGRPGQDERSRKAESVLKAQQLFPWMKFPLVRDHNAADAVLLAEYMRRTYPL